MKSLRDKEPFIYCLLVGMSFTEMVPGSQNCHEILRSCIMLLHLIAIFADDVEEIITFRKVTEQVN